MCEICLQTPCDPRCPNAPEPDTVATCTRCHDDIFPGQEYFDGPEGPICKDCLQDMTSMEILEMFGESLRTA